MKKLLTILLVLVAAVSTAFAFSACDLNELFGNTNNGDTTDNSGDNTSGDNTPSGVLTPNGGSTSNNGNASGGNSTPNGGNTSGGNTSGGNTSGGNTSGGNTSGGTTTHTCSYVLTSTVSADCTNQGYDLYSCTCGKTDKRNYTKALGHDYKETIHNKTCTTDWWEEKECKRCGDYVTNTIADSKLPHDYEWTSVQNATCTVDGLKSGKCKACGTAGTEVIKATGHSYGVYTPNNDATCTQDGTESAVCADCNHVDTQTIAGSKTAHNYVASNMNNYPAACERDGKETKICTVCKDTVSKVLPATGHSFVSGVCKDCNVVEASLTGGLVISEYNTHCVVSGLGTASGYVVIPATYNGKPVTDIGFVFNGYSRPEVSEKVTGLVIPDTVTNIPADACFGCENLESVVIGNGVTELVDNAFGGCPKLKTVTIGKNVTYINWGAFWKCTGIETIIFNGTKAQWNAITKDNGWDSSFGSYTVRCTDGNI